MKNLGKRFEENFEKSICKSIYFHKLRDSASSWNGGTMSRFTINNPCDYIVFNPTTKQMFMLELKHTKSASLPLGNIKKNQIDGLTKSNKFGIVSGFLIRIREYCFYLDIEDFNKFIESSTRKSIPLSYLLEFGIQIPFKQLQTNYRYDVSSLLSMVR